MTPLRAGILLLGLMLPHGAAARAQTAGPSGVPILRVEAGMHTARITQLDVDAEGRYLVTSSDDKTARVWDLTTGTLAGVLRPPIGDGAEGRLYAVAISPDGGTVAAAGWTGHQWELTNSIYLFERQSGRLVSRIKGLPNAVFRLKYSPDGRYLAAGLSLTHGLRLYDASSREPVWQDDEYGGSIYGLDFDASGRIVTSSVDGFVRLYGPGEDGAPRLLARGKPEGGRLPRGVSFSPDGSKVALGFTDSDRVHVLSGKDLSRLYSPDTSHPGQHPFTFWPPRAGARDFMLDAFPSVAWSADGATLYAGGTLRADGKYMIRVWPEGGRGRARDVAAAAHAILHLVALRDGGVAYGTADPLIGVVDAGGHGRVIAGRTIASYAHGRTDLLLSPDGSTVQFNYGPPDHRVGRFSVTGRSLEGGAAGADELRPPKTTGGGFKLEFERDARAYKLNGRPLPLASEHLEGVTRIAVSPDKQHLLLGTNFHVRLFDKKGREVWKVVAPGFTEAVNISGDGQLAVAAFNDGTIRWFRMADGEELLAFFPFIDGARWVLWTQAGYYDASPGADELVGWHVNNGIDGAADFFPLRQVSAVFRRPDVVVKTLALRDADKALRLADRERGLASPERDIARMLPPVVEIVSVREEESPDPKATIHFRVRSPSGEPVTKIEVLIDGQSVGRELGLEAAARPGQVREVTVRPPRRGSQVSIVAGNRFFESTPASTRVRR